MLANQLKLSTIVRKLALFCRGKLKIKFTGIIAYLTPRVK